MSLRDTGKTGKRGWPGRSDEFYMDGWSLRAWGHPCTLVQGIIRKPGLEEIVRDGMEMASYASGGNPHRRNGRVRGWGVGVGNLPLFGFASCVVLH